VLVGTIAAGILGDVVGVIPVLVFQGLGFFLGGLAVLARRHLFTAAPADPVASEEPEVLTLDPSDAR
jgi:hypothetical protein